jgi:ectoine hydroxylase-related dioxygenase (phytanoyl-CoA dioxygenase family)
MDSGLDPQIVRRFDQDGFVAIPDFFTSEEVERYGAVVDAAVARRTATDGRTVEDKSTYEQSFVQCMRLWETDRAVAPLSFHAGLAQAAAELLGVPSVRLWQDQALYKEPGGRITDPHQDATFWPIGDSPLISAWIPFDGSTRESGATAYVPGSHKAGRLKVVDITHTTEPYDILSDPRLDGREPVVVEAPSGSVVWHHGLTVHEASANTTRRMRRTFTVVYIAEDARREKGWRCFPLDREGIEVGEALRGAGLPVAWPRTSRDLPEPPAVLGGPTGPQNRPGA